MLCLGLFLQVLREGQPVFFPTRQGRQGLPQKGYPRAGQFLKISLRIAIPSGSYRAQKPQGRKYEKNTKSPTPGWAPKIRKNYRKKHKNGHFRGIFVFFSVIFLCFRGPTRGGGFCIFFVIFSYFLGGFCALYEPDGIAILETIV